MTDQELQVAIDSAREFMNLTSSPGGVLHTAREQTRIHLRELEKIQVIRAAAVVDLGSTEPKINNAFVPVANGSCSMCHGSGITTAGYTCPCKNITMFSGTGITRSE